MKGTEDIENAVLSILHVIPRRVRGTVVAQLNDLFVVAAVPIVIVKTKEAHSDGYACWAMQPEEEVAAGYVRRLKGT